MQHRKEPGEAHQSLMRGLRAVVDQHGANGMAGVERIAVLSQLIGQEIAALPPGLPFGPTEIMVSVVRNVEVGNQQATAGNASGLLGFGGSA